MRSFLLCLNYFVSFMLNTLGVYVCQCDCMCVCRYGDMRIRAGYEMLSMWQVLGECDRWLLSINQSVCFLKSRLHDTCDSRLHVTVVFR